MSSNDAPGGGGGSGIFPSAGGNGGGGGGQQQQGSPTITGIFPSATTGRGMGHHDDHDRGNSANGVYYLVFLGVLLALIVIAAGLTYRSYRMRRRYRTATQMAIARGDPMPSNWWGVDDDLFSLGVWRGAPGPLDRWAAVGRPGARRDRRWMPIPVLYDAVPKAEKEEESKGKEAEEEGDELWDEIQPLTVHSLAPPPENAEQPAPPPPPQSPPSTPGRFRNAGAGFRRRWLDSVPPPTPPAAPTRPQPNEADRNIAPGDPVRVAIIVQMPTSENEPASSGRSGFSDGDDEVGWRHGMEIGVWEGAVAGEPGVSLNSAADAAGLPVYDSAAAGQYPPNGTPPPHNPYAPPQQYAHNPYAPPQQYTQPAQTYAPTHNPYDAHPLAQPQPHPHPNLHPHLHSHSHLQTYMPPNVEASRYAADRADHAPDAGAGYTPSTSFVPPATAADAGEPIQSMDGGLQGRAPAVAQGQPHYGHSSGDAPLHDPR